MTVAPKARGDHLIPKSLEFLFNFRMCISNEWNDICWFRGLILDWEIRLLEKLMDRSDADWKLMYTSCLSLSFHSVEGAWDGHNIAPGEYLRSSSNVIEIHRDLSSGSTHTTANNNVHNFVSAASISTLIWLPYVPRRQHPCRPPIWGSEGNTWGCPLGDQEAPRCVAFRPPQRAVAPPLRPEPSKGRFSASLTCPWSVLCNEYMMAIMIVSWI